MRHRRFLAAAALLAFTSLARAEHFEYDIDLQGTYSLGGTEGCTPPNFSEPACPRNGFLMAHLSFDTPMDGDGSWSITDHFGDITDFSIDLGALPGDSLYGGVNVNGGVPNGFVTASDQTETFSFDWATRTASYTYDYGYHGAFGTFAGTMLALPEPAAPLMLLAGLMAVAGVRRRARA